MKIKVFCIQSILRHDGLIAKESKELLDDLSNLLSTKIEIIESFENITKNDFIMILVQSGGSENYFKTKIYPNYSGPYYLLTYSSNNSLAASLEILSFIKANKRNGEVLHGSHSYISNRILELIKEQNNEKNYDRLGVFGKPSDWLIASDVDYEVAKNVFNIELVDVKEDEIVEEIKKVKLACPDLYKTDKVNSDDLDKAYSVKIALHNLIEKYNLKGFAIRCFDLIPIFKMTPCFALALLNEKDIISTCEGDIPSMITAFLVKKCLNAHAFQANPQSVNPETNEVEFAHCTLPLDMANHYELTTHFESGIGIGIHGDMTEGACTVVKISPRLDEYYVEEGKIEQNECRSDRCRTQIKIKLDGDATYFLKNPLANHHLIVYGHHKNELEKFLNSYGLKMVKF